MAETVKRVVDFYDEAPDVDRRVVYDQLWQLSEELKDRVAGRFELTRDPSTEDLEDYGAAPGEGARGRLRASSGPEMDWFVHAWTGQPERSFTNIHVTSWLGPHVKVPHLGYAFGTLPNVWFLIEYVPRSDLSVDLESLERYYEPVNGPWLDLRADERFQPFVSRSLYIRQVMSETSFCYSCQGTDDDLATIRELAHREMDRWLGWLDDAPLVPEEERAALAARDLAVRRNTAELDPANELGERFFGPELTRRLVRTLWGGDRQLPRPDGSGVGGGGA
jgi:hypothetical protein